MKIERIHLENVFCFEDTLIPPEGEFGYMNCFIGKNDRGKSLVLKLFDMIFYGVQSNYLKNIGSTGSIQKVDLNAKSINLIKENKKGLGKITVYLNFSKEDHILDNVLENEDILRKYSSLQRFHNLIITYLIRINEDFTGEFLRDRVLVGNINTDQWVDVSDFGGLANNVNEKINMSFGKYAYVLIPALRNISTESQIPLENVWDFSTNGAGLANAIFEGKNRPDLGKRNLFREVDTEVSDLTGFNEVIGVTVTNGRDVEFNEIPQTFIGDATKQIYISFFNLLNSQAKIVGFEEPESHLHPQRQKLLIKRLIEMSKENNTQFFITTHSPFILDQFKLSNVYNFKKIKNTIIAERLHDNDELWDLLLSLGVRPHDILQNDMTIFVEGPSDRKILELFSKKLGYDLYNDNINMVDLRGTYRNIEVEYLQEINRNFLVVLNSHKGIIQSETEIKEIKNLFNKYGLNDKLKILTKREIENYLSVRAIKEEFSIMDDVKIEDDTDVISVVESLRGISNRGIRWRKTKNGPRIASNMNVNEIDEEIIDLFKKIYKKLHDDNDIN